MDSSSAAGVSQGALFKHFPSKTALLGAAVETLFERVSDAFRRAIEEAEGDAFDLDWCFQCFAQNVLRDASQRHLSNQDE